MASLPAIAPQERRRAPIAQLVEQQPFKLKVTGSNPVWGTY